MWHRGHFQWHHITCLPNFIKIYLSFQKLLVGDTYTHTHTHTHRHTQTGDLINLLLFLESKLKIVFKYTYAISCTPECFALIFDVCKLSEGILLKLFMM
jgi:hypothetical protein